MVTPGLYRPGAVIVGPGMARFSCFSIIYIIYKRPTLAGDFGPER